MNQEEIIRQLNVKAEINPEEEFKRRKNFMKAYVKKVKVKGFVLGISGGQDSTLLGKIAQTAVEELREEEAISCRFVALRLPYGQQKDGADAEKALEFINPDETITINIKPAVDASSQSFKEALGREMMDFNKGNTKARERMKIQYDIAAEYDLLVLGTDHAAEAVLGFFTKHGDGAADIAPLFGLNKRQGKLMLRTLGAPVSLYEKIPMADLEDDRPGISDEEATGLPYETIDDFLEGKEIDAEDSERIIKLYKTTEHKRQLPVSPLDDWWQKH